MSLFAGAQHSRKEDVESSAPQAARAQNAADPALPLSQRAPWGGDARSAAGVGESSMARPISATHDRQREQILDLAAQCFARQSFPATSMNAIAAACGTSKARLYHYYESKEAILFDLLDRYTQRLLAVIGESEARAQRK
ncbi:MAG: hypothetical protein ACI83N_002271, partial [Hydrogenophaga sp.]